MAPVVAASGALIMTAVVIAGWAFDIAVLRSFLPRRVEMKILTAAAAVVLAISVLLHVRGSRPARRLSVAGAVTVMFVGFVSLLEAVSGSEIWRGVLVFDVASAPETIARGRMAPNTAAGFLALAFAVATAGSRLRLVRAASSAAVIFAALLSLEVLTGYLYRADEARGLSGFSPMSLPAACVLALLTLATGPLLRDQLPFSLLTGDRASAVAARTLIPLAFLVPLAFGILRLRGEQSGFYGTRYGVALFAVFNAAVIASLIWWSTARLRKAEAAAENRQRMLQGANRVQEMIASAELDTGVVSSLIVNAVQGLAAGDGAALIHVEDGKARVAIACGSATFAEGAAARLDETLLRAAVKDALRWDVEQGEHDPLLSRLGRKQVIAVPLPSSDAAVPIVVVARANPPFTGEEADILRLIAPAAGAALEHSASYERRQAALREQEAELESLQQQFRAFMENIPAAAFVKDQGGRYLYGNPMLSRFLGRPLDEVLGLTDADILDEAVVSRFAVGETAAKGQQKTVSEILRVSGGDPTYWLLLRFPIAEKGRHLLGGVAIDVSDLKRAQEHIVELNASLEQRIAKRTSELQKANSELDAFSYSVSHDLRAPLRAIGGYAQILEEDYAAALDSEGARYLATIRSEARRMAHLIDDLLSFSRFGRQQLALAPLDLRTLLEEVVHDIIRRGDRPIEVKIGEIPPALGDRAALRHVVENLLSNAVKYSPSAEGAEIEIGGRCEGDFNLYWIRDHGVGFDMKYAHKLFGVFQRLHSDDEFEGTGVGLAIVERIVTRHGGRVWAESEVGKGATFFFTLPAADFLAKEAS